MRTWNKESFGKIEVNNNSAVEEIKLLDDKIERDAPEERDILKRKQLFESFWKLSRMQEAFSTKNPE